MPANIQSAEVEARAERNTLVTKGIIKKLSILGLLVAVFGVVVWFMRSSDCRDLVMVELEGALAEPGAYRVTLVADGVPAVCDFALDNRTRPPKSSQKCQSEWLLTEWSSLGLSAVGVQGAPRSVSLEVTRASAVVTRARFTPKYERSGACKQARVRLSRDVVGRAGERQW